MHRPRILAIVQAGGQGSRMDVLARESPKPTLPFAGSYRLIDFPLSNLHYSGISDVWLSVQYLGQALGDYVGNGSAWDLDRRHGGFRLLMPEEGAGSDVDDGFSAGNAEELYSRRDAIRRFAPDAVVVLSSDHIYRLDYTEVVDRHLEREAECTVVTTEVGREDAGHHATITSNRRHRVTEVDYKPDEPAHGIIATEVFVYHPDALIEVLEQLHRDAAARPDPDPAGLGDFGDKLLPELVRRGRTYAHPLPGYWRDLGRPEAYLAAHRELLHHDTGLFEDPDRPVLSNRVEGPGARFRPGSSLSDSLVGLAGDVAGTVVNSVLGPRVVVEAGAEVHDSVIFGDVTVAAGARIDWSLVDRGCRIGPDATVGQANPDDVQDSGYVTMLGRDCVVGRGARVERGGRLEPGTTV